MTLESSRPVFDQQNLSLLERTQETMHTLRVALGRVAAAALLVAGGTTALTAAEDLALPAVAYADDLGYPYANAPCEYGGGHNPAGNNSCANPAVPDNGDPYNWYESADGTFSGGDCGYRGASSECFDPLGYGFDSCTSFVAWQLTNLGVNDSVVRGLGNGGEWYDKVPASERSLTPAYAEVGVELPTATNPYGHVAFIKKVNSVDSTNPENDNITVYEYNYHKDGNGGIRTGTASALGFTRFVNFGIQDTSVTSAGNAGPALAMNQATGLATAVAEGPHNSLYAYWQNTQNGQWAGPLGIDGGAAGIAYSRPAVSVNRQTGLATAVAEGPNHSLYAYWQTSTNGQWSGPYGIDRGAPNIAYSDPAIVFNPNTGLPTVVADGPNNSLYAYWQNTDGSWSGPLGLDNGASNIAYSAPAIAFNTATQTATVVVEGPSNSLYAYWQKTPNGQWTGPLGIDGGQGGIAYSAPAIDIDQTAGRATAVAEGPNGSLYAYWQSSVNGQWAGPLGIDGGASNIAYAAPSLVMNQTTETATVVAEGPNNSLRAYWQNDISGQWSGPLGLDSGAPNLAYSVPAGVINSVTGTAAAVAEGPNHSLYAYWQNARNGQWTGPLGIAGGVGGVAY